MSGIVIAIDPVIGQIGPFVLRWYRLFFALVVLAGVLPRLEVPPGQAGAACRRAACQRLVATAGLPGLAPPDPARRPLGTAGVTGTLAWGRAPRASLHRFQPFLLEGT